MGNEKGSTKKPDLSQKTAEGRRLRLQRLTKGWGSGKQGEREHNRKREKNANTLHPTEKKGDRKENYLPNEKA